MWEDATAAMSKLRSGTSVEVEREQVELAAALRRESLALRAEALAKEGETAARKLEEIVKEKVRGRKAELALNKEKRERRRDDERWLEKEETWAAERTRLNQPIRDLDARGNTIASYARAFTAIPIFFFHIRFDGGEGKGEGGKACFGQGEEREGDMTKGCWRRKKRGRPKGRDWVNGSANWRQGATLWSLVRGRLQQIPNFFFFFFFSIPFSLRMICSLWLG
jgi:hypothetical protein